ncbi:MAG: DNA gyrase inhibitor YacG [Caulobacter sp.]|nr:DNA gyrase inhibitor YacG [Caulobacter sp.]
MTRACVRCDQPMDPAYRPFCSKRCADIDLQKWLTGGYAIPAVESEAQSDDDGDDQEG